MTEGRIAGFETAARHASARVPVAPPDATAAQTRSALVGGDFETASHVVVLEHGRFVGIGRIEALLAAADHALVREIMDSDAPVVAPGIDQEVAAWTAVRRREAALAVVDGDGEFVGLIPPDRLLAILLAEHDEDLTRIGGFLKSTAEVRETSLEPVRRRYRHRLPWLLVGLTGSLGAAALVGGFESQLEEVVMLAFFIPAIVYLADAVGTQTETVVVRGLSVGIGLRSMMAREVLGGLAIGATLAAVGGPLVWWGWGDATIALIVSLSVFSASAVATLTAMLLPWLLSAGGRDPAFGSGPLATVIQDLLSILIYFAIASALLN